MCTFAINAEHNGIEISFNEKPAEAIRTAMKNLGFRWHGQRHVWYAKNTSERMELAKKLSSDSNPTQVAAAAIAAAEPTSKYGIKPGDILYDSFGYNMTIVEFYKVTKILSATKVEIIELGHKLTGEGDRGGGEYVLPDTERPIGEALVKQVAQSSYEKPDGRWHIKINNSVSLTPWDGRPKYQNTYD